MMKPPKIGTVAVVLAYDDEVTQSSGLDWIETLSDEGEIEVLENRIREGASDPITELYAHRERLKKEDDEFGDFIENLVTQKNARLEVQEHGMAWLNSKMRLDEFRQQEQEAAEVIASFAVKKVKENPKLQDFMIAGPGVSVRVKIFRVRPPIGVSALSA